MQFRLKSLKASAGREIGAAFDRGDKKTFWKRVAVVEGRHKNSSVQHAAVIAGERVFGVHEVSNALLKAFSANYAA